MQDIGGVLTLLPFIEQYLIDGAYYVLGAVTVKVS